MRLILGFLKCYHRNNTVQAVLCACYKITAVVEICLHCGVNTAKSVGSPWFTRPLSIPKQAFVAVYTNHTPTKPSLVYSASQHRFVVASDGNPSEGRGFPVHNTILIIAKTLQTEWCAPAGTWTHTHNTDVQNKREVSRPQGSTTKRQSKGEGGVRGDREVRAATSGTPLPSPRARSPCPRPPLCGRWAPAGARPWPQSWSTRWCGRRGTRPCSGRPCH